MPTLILELTDKTDEKKLEQSHKWFSDISHFYSITKVTLSRVPLDFESTDSFCLS